MQIQLKNFVFLLILLTFACGNSRNPVDPEGNAKLGFYFLENDTLSGIDISEMPIKDLSLKKESWLSAEDMVRYDFSSHLIYLNRDKYEIYKNFEIEGRLLLTGKPFIVVANGKRCYVAAFQSSYSSFAMLSPAIMDYQPELIYYPSDIISLSSGSPKDDDVRNNSDVKQALSELGLLHEGLSVALNSIQVIENGDTATVRYSYTLTNHDSDNLLVLDPEKAGNDWFHFFCPALTILDRNQEYYTATKRKHGRPDPEVRWDAAWFTVLESGSSITRTVDLKGFSEIPVGNYSSYFTFNHPSVIEGNSLTTAEGRYWLGWITSDNFEFKI